MLTLLTVASSVSSSLDNWVKSDSEKLRELQVLQSENRLRCCCCSLNSASSSSKVMKVSPSSWHKSWSEITTEGGLSNFPSDEIKDPMMGEVGVVGTLDNDWCAVVNMEVPVV